MTGLIFPAASGAALSSTASIGTRWATAERLVGGNYTEAHDLDTVANLVTSAGDGTWSNSANVGSAAIASSILTVTNGTGGTTDWAGGTTTAPVYGWDVLGSRAVFKTHYLQPDAGTIQTLVNGIAIYTSNLVKALRLELLDTTTRTYDKGSGTATTGTAYSDAEVIEGVWLALALDGALVRALYSQGSADEEVDLSDMTLLSETSVFAAGDAIRVGLFTLDNRTPQLAFRSQYDVLRLSYSAAEVTY